MGASPELHAITCRAWRVETGCWPLLETSGSGFGLRVCDVTNLAFSNRCAWKKAARGGSAAAAHAKWTRLLFLSLGGFVRTPNSNILV